MADTFARHMVMDKGNAVAITHFLTRFAFMNFMLHFDFRYARLFMVYCILSIKSAFKEHYLQVDTDWSHQI